jgi:hypothetical protein
MSGYLHSHRASIESSDNWGGYVALGSSGTFKEARGSFTIPSLDPSVSGIVSPWVGLGGKKTSAPLVQAGIDSTMSSGKQSNRAWIEAFSEKNNVEKYFTFNRGLHAGDIISIVVSSNLNNNHIDNFYIENTNTRENISFSLRGPHLSDGTSGECVLEKLEGYVHGDNGGPDPLANFGIQQFSGCRIATGKNSVLSPIGNYKPTKINLARKLGSKILLATPLKLDSTGQAFDVKWLKSR